MKQITVYRSYDGLILQAHSMPDDAELMQLPLTAGTVSGFGNALTQYVKDGEIVSRPEFDITVIYGTLQGVPEHAEIKIDGSTYIADGSIIELEFSSAGPHHLTFALWPYIDTVITIEN